MAGLKRGCVAGKSSRINTGQDGNCQLGVAAGVIIVPRGTRLVKEDMDAMSADILDFFNERFHDDPSKRWLPMFIGAFNFEFSRGQATTETNQLDNTESIILQAGFGFTYTYNTGGLCLAGELAKLQGGAYDYIPFDKEGKFLLVNNGDGSYSGLSSSVITPDFEPTTAAATGKNKITFATPYLEYVSAEVFNTGGAPVAKLNGLNPIELEAVAHTATTFDFNILKECDKNVMIDNYPEFASASNFIFRRINATTGAVLATVTPLSVTIVNGIIRATFATANAAGTYTAELAPASVLFANGISNYDGVEKAEFVIT